MFMQFRGSSADAHPCQCTQLFKWFYANLFEMFPVLLFLSEDVHVTGLDIFFRLILISFLHFQATVNGLKFRTLYACQKDMEKQPRPRKDCF